MSVLYCVNLEQLYLKDMLAFVVYLKLAFTRGFARKFQNVLKLCFYFHVLL
jgi:hypothetical protein